MTERDTEREEREREIDQPVRRVVVPIFVCDGPQLQLRCQSAQFYVVLINLCYVLRSQSKFWA